MTNTQQSLTTCTNPAHSHIEEAGAEVPTCFAPSTATTFPGGVSILTEDAPMFCHDCGEPTHYDYGIEGYRHDDPAVACFLHPATLPAGATPCTTA